MYVSVLGGQWRTQKQVTMTCAVRMCSSYKEQLRREREITEAPLTFLLNYNWVHDPIIVITTYHKHGDPIGPSPTDKS